MTNFGIQVVYTDQEWNGESGPKLILRGPKSGYRAIAALLEQGAAAVLEIDATGRALIFRAGRNKTAFVREGHSFRIALGVNAQKNIVQIFRGLAGSESSGAFNYVDVEALGGAPGAREDFLLIAEAEE